MNKLPAMRIALGSMVLWAVSVSGPVKALDCDALGRADLSNVPEAPMQLTRTEFVAASDDAPAYCRAVGYVTPNVGIEIRLPAEDAWNGKLLMRGCGGFCGAILGIT